MAKNITAKTKTETKTKAKAKAKAKAETKPEAGTPAPAAPGGAERVCFGFLPPGKTAGAGATGTYDVFRRGTEVVLKLSSPAGDFELVFDRDAAAAMSFMLIHTALWGFEEEKLGGPEPTPKAAPRKRARKGAAK